MNVREMIIEVQQQLQKQGASKTRKFFDEEIVWALNKSQLKWRDTCIRKKPQDNGAYEIDQLYADALRVWTIEMASITPLVNQQTPRITTSALLPDNYAYLLNDMTSMAITCNSTVTQSLTNNRLSRHSTLRNVLDLPYYKSTSKSPVSSLAGKTLTVYRDTNFTVNAIYIDYLRKPAKISLTLFNNDPATGNCEAPEEFHQAICDLTVELLAVDIMAQNATMKIQQNQVTG